MKKRKIKNEYYFYNFDGKLVFKTTSKKKAREFLVKHGLDDCILSINVEALLKWLRKVKKNESDR
jgi:hypothetical protein